jgi:hypothetical protein
MDEILKRLFTLKNTMPIIDFLNAAYNDNISYDAKLYYADKEINNFDKKSSRYISFYTDMYIKVIDREKIYEYEIEFQTVYENSMAIRMFRYGFERAVKLADYNSIKSYFLGMYGRYTDFDEEVKVMVKSFYDPKVEERGIQKGIEKGIERGKIEEKIETA